MCLFMLDVCLDADGGSGHVLSLCMLLHECACFPHIALQSCSDCSHLGVFEFCCAGTKVGVGIDLGRGDDAPYEEEIDLLESEAPAVDVCAMSCFA